MIPPCHLQRLLAVFLILPTLSFATPAKTVNVNIGGTTYSGPGAASDTGTTWTTTLAPDPSGRDPGNPDLRSLPASDGSPTCMGMNHNYPYSGTYGSPAISLFSSYLHNNNTPTLVTLSGLHSSSSYNLFFYGARPGLNETLTVTIGGVTKTMVTQGNTSSFVQGQNYVRFDAITPDVHGEVAVTLGGGASTVNLLSGYQVQEVQPIAPTQTLPTRNFANRLRNGEHLKFAFLGTSLTNGTWKWADTFGEWLDARFPGQTDRYNYGWGATATSEPVNLPYGMRRLLPALDVDPDVVFIEFSMNDSLTSYGISLAQSRANLEGIINAILNGHPNREVVLLTMQNCTPDNATYDRPQLPAYYDLCRDLAAERKLLLIDHYWNWLKILNENPTVYNTYIQDGIHSQLAGYRAVHWPEFQRCLLGENQWGSPYSEKTPDANTVDGTGSRDRFLWHLDQSQLTGSNLPSSTGVGDMVLTNGASLTFGRFSEGVTPGTSDPSARAVSTAAGTALASTSATPLGTNPSLTVECSFKLSQAGVEQVLICKRADPLGGAPHTGLSMWVGTDNHLKASWGLGSQSVILSADAVTLAAGQQHHAAVVWDHYVGMARLFLDGVERASQTVAGASLSLDGQALVLANSGASPWKPLKGMIDEVRVSNKEDPFTASAVYTAPPTDPSTPASSLIWDGGPGALMTDDAVTPGTGTWANGGTNWDDGIVNSANGTWTDGSDATFSGTAGTVTISDAVNAHNLTFSSGYTVTGGPITLSGTTPAITTAPSVTATIGSIIAGSAGLSKLGTGTLILSGANSFTGGVTITAGTLQSGNGGSGGSLGTGAIIDNGALIYNQTAIAIGGGISGTGTVSGTTAGALTIGQSIALTNNNFAFTSAGAGTLATGANLAIGTGTGSINSSSTAGAGFIFGGTSSLSGNISISGTSSAGGGNRGLEISGSNLTTSGSVNLLGSVSGAGYGSGVLAATTLHATSGTTTLTSRQTTASSGKASFIFFVSGGTMTLSADPTAAIVMTGAGTAASNMIFWDFVNNSIVAANGNVSFASGVTSSTNTFWTGATTFNVGASSSLTLDAGAAGMTNPLKIGSMGANSTVTIAASGTGTMSGAHTISLSTDSLIYNISGAGTLTQSGIVSGAGSLTKSGSGVLTLNAVDTYTGSTIVSGGTLQLSGSGSLANSSIIDVQTGGTLSASSLTIGPGKSLQGAGVVNAPLTVSSGGVLSPGENGIGSLSLGATSLNGTYNCQISGATADTIDVTGNLALGAGSVIACSQVAPASASSFTIATYTGTLTGTPNVTGIPSGYRLNTATAGQIKLTSVYSTWIAGFSGLSDSTPQGDPDHDGIPNIIEFLTNGNPAVSSEANLPTFSAVGPSLVFTFVLRDDAVYLNPTVEFSTSLSTGAWVTAVNGSNSTIASVDNGSGTHTVTVTIPKSSQTKLFARLKVAIP